MTPAIAGLFRIQEDDVAADNEAQIEADPQAEQASKMVARLMRLKWPIQTRLKLGLQTRFHGSWKVVQGLEQTDLYT